MAMWYNWTMNIESSSRFWAGMAIVAALAAKDAGENGWRSVTDALLEGPEDTVVETREIVSAETLAALREKRPRYVTFVMLPEEIDCDTIRGIKRMMCSIDDDPFDDAMWGIVTGPTASDAKRVAACKGPKMVTNVLATTGVDKDIVPGPVTVVSDAYPAGEWWQKRPGMDVERHSTTGDTSHVFAEAWNRDDPDLILTSSHASERNLEMPFSRGNIVACKEGLAAAANAQLIDYSTGQAIEGAADQVKLNPLKAPQREKVWLAAGNCLIANHKPGYDMIMSALGFGKVNQFVGYINTSWYGEIGWKTLQYFWSYGLSLSESWYAANLQLTMKLTSSAPKSDHDRMGLMWDFDGTAFYGNPRKRVTVPESSRKDAYRQGDPPLLVIFPDSKPNRRLVSAPEGFEVFVGDDFALVTSWPELAEDWREKLEFSE